MGGAANGDCGSRNLRVVASLGAAGIGETPTNGTSNCGISLICRLRVLRRSGCASDPTALTCRGGYLRDVAVDLVLVSFARAELPLFTEGVVGIVEAKLAETSLWGVPVSGFVLGLWRSELVFAV